MIDVAVNSHCRDWMFAAGIVVVLVFGMFCVGWIVIGVIRSARRYPLLDLPAVVWRVFFAVWFIIIGIGVVAVMANPLLRFVPGLRRCGVH
jgi:hypothetical protein